MKIKASIVVMSHISDAEESRGLNLRGHLEFAKFIILRTNGNLNQEIDADELWKEYFESIDKTNKQK